MVVGQHTARHRHREVGDAGLLDEAAHLRLGAAEGDALADHDQRLLGGLEGGEGVRDGRVVGAQARRVRHARGPFDAVLVDLIEDDVARQIEVGGAGRAVDRLAYGLGDVEREALGALGAARVLGVRGHRRDLLGLLEVAHVGAGRVGGAAEHQQRPAVGPGVGEGADGVERPRPGDHEADADTAVEVAGGLPGVGGGHLVAHSVVADALVLGGGGDAAHRDADHAEDGLDTLRLERARDNRFAVDHGHRNPAFLLRSRWYVIAPLTAQLRARVNPVASAARQPPGT